MLAKQHLLQDYRHAAKQEVKDDSTPTVRGVVYIETDRRLEDKTGRELHEWAHQPTEEIKFLRSIVENRDAQRDADMLLGIVLWAPMRSDKRTFSDWFSHAEQTACPETWRRVKGFRFLLQDITDRQTFEGISLGTSVIANLKSLLMSGRRYSFDVGVDAHSAGVWQLEYFATIIERVHARVSYEFHKVMFILSKSTQHFRILGERTAINVCQIIYASQISHKPQRSRRWRILTDGALASSVFRSSHAFT